VFKVWLRIVVCAVCFAAGVWMVAHYDDAADWIAAVVLFIVGTAAAVDASLERLRGALREHGRRRGDR
jgi:hypothetical protein